MKKILLIDDNDEHLNEVKEVILDHIDNIRVFIADSGKEGIKIARKEIPDTIISDVLLPEMDGIEICRTIKEDEKIGIIPVIMLTGSRTDAGTRSRCLQAGADVFLTKPIDAEELIAQIQVMLRIKKAEDQLRRDKEHLESIVAKKTKELQKANLTLKKDIEEKEKVQQQLEASQESLSIILERIPFAVFAHKLDGKFILVNQAASDYTGYTKEELMGMTVSKIDHESITRNDRKNIWNQLQLGGCKSIISNHYRKNGTKYPMEANIVAITVNNEPVILAIVQDITERLKASMELKKSEQHYRSLFENAHDAIMIFNPDHEVVLEVNERACNLYGFERDEFIGMSLKNISKNYDRGRKYVDKTIEYKSLRHFETIHYHKDGSEIIIESNASVIQYNGDKAILAVNRDITQRKKAEHAVKESERKLSTLLANLPGIAYRCRNVHNWTMEFISQGCKELTGYEPEELINDNIISYNAIIHPDDREMVWDMIQKALEKDEQYVLEYRIITKDKEVRWVWERGKKITFDNGVPEMIEGFISDITLRKLASQELIKNRERLKTASSIIRHDILNDLVVIQSALNLYRDDNDKSMLLEIDKRLEKSMSTIEKHREQERYLDSHIELDEYDLLDVISEIAKNYSNIAINCDGNAKVYADNAIYSVFDNIIDNAIKHAQASSIDISINTSDENCEVRIADNGNGVPDHIKEKIFDEGFKFGEEGHTGIGLYIVRNTIEEYGGYVTIEDNEPRGAIFILHMQKVISQR